MRQSARKRGFSVRKITPHNKWVLLLGASNSGKTTLLDAFSKAGYNTKPEASHEVILEYKERGIPFLDMLQDPKTALQFQEDVAARELAAEAQLDPTQLVFFDRVSIDYVVMTRLRNLQPNPNTMRKMANRDYAFACMLETLPGTSDVKLESVLDDQAAEARRQAAMYRQVVHEYDIPIVDVHIATVEERMQFVLDQCSMRNVL